MCVVGIKSDNWSNVWTSEWYWRKKLLHLELLDGGVKFQKSKRNLRKFRRKGIKISKLKISKLEKVISRIFLELEVFTGESKDEPTSGHFYC